ncbi:hypothetical protein JQ621_24605 [Bradyrhizobium manausense]|uniref:hypothetical protein n=1 Tax=Bradyrhizobium manausense TaxID=989370 RepID=UPI001BA78A70|nr:hypothetical protein [Bradyrhizobium manausense]MBR1090660.1 hypothetical protein [Bradyrhizobium manausense]
MADTDLPKNWEGAARWFLGGTIVFASGFEAVVLFWEGKMAAAAGSLAFAIVLMAILIYWDHLKAKMPAVASAVTSAASDARLWAIVLLALAAFGGFATSGAQLVVGGGWIYALPLFIGLVLFFAAWRFLGPKEQTPAQVVPAAGQPVELPQTSLDISLLLHFAVDIATLAMLRDLVAKAPAGLSREIIEAESYPEARTLPLRDYVQEAETRLGRGTLRHSSFVNLMSTAEFEAEREVEQMPPEKMRTVDPFALRRFAIANLQCFRALGFLRAQMQEKEEEIRNQRDQLIQRLSARENR